MATNLEKLRVSLTKHGAHKIAYLLRKFDKDEVLLNLNGQVPGIKIEFTQAHKNLSADTKNIVPQLWNEIRRYGDEDIYDLVFIAITFSHVSLISALTVAFEKDCTLVRGDVIAGKAYTNYAHIIDEFGYSLEHTPDYVTFDLSRIFHKFYLPQLVSGVLTLKLESAGWNKRNSLVEECLRLGWNSAFGLSSSTFRRWLEKGEELQLETIEKLRRPKKELSEGIKFVVGHRSKLEGEISYVKTDKQRATLEHNKIQNRVFAILNQRFPNQIGTEVKTNAGSVDIARKIGSDYHFYEIKTARSSRSNIRQALSQLLEYGYWNASYSVTKLIIVSPVPLSKPSEAYLRFLREKFNIPIRYVYFDIEANVLGEEI